MSSKSCSFLLITIALIFIAETAIQRQCDPESGVCSEIDIETNGLSLGQKLLEKQTEFYHLNKLSYSEDSAAQSIKIYNPNDATYDYYWFDTYRNKGNYCNDCMICQYHSYSDKLQIFRNLQRKIESTGYDGNKFISWSHILFY